MFDMNQYVLLWLVILIVFTGLELITVALTSIWFATGALVAMFVAMAGGTFILQFIVFSVTAFGILVATRPWANKFVNTKKQHTNADRAIGEEVRVLKRISNIDQTGMVVVHGQEWTARTENDKDVIEQGELVRILRISGVKLIVEKVKES